ncbi:MAG: thioredoxin family protein [Ferruginibacter sp.]
MKKIFLSFFSLFAIFISLSAQPVLDSARKIAADKHELILLNFSGSDWCGPCIRMHKEILDTKSFKKVSEDNLVMINADFPRKKKNQLSKKLQKQNDALAEKYNPTGKFPYTLLLNAEGKVVKTWDGLPDENAEQFADEVKALCKNAR